MTDSDLRELDGWIAEKFMGWKRISPASSSNRVHPLAWESPIGLVTWETTSYNDAFRPSTLPAAFALVKREIERRGWDWLVEYAREAWPVFGFYVYTNPKRDAENTWIGKADSEELAGCLAVKAAVAISSSIPT